MWLILHAFGLWECLSIPGPLGRAASSGSLGEQRWLIALLLVNAALFVFLRRSDPGYVRSTSLKGAPHMQNHLSHGHNNAASSAGLDTKALGHYSAKEYPAERDRLLEKGGAAPFCAVCNVPQPEGCRHCRRCNRCVKGFDHHCIWIGNCVGDGNKEAFLAYLCTQTSLIVAALHNCISGFSLQHSKLIGWHQAVLTLSIPFWLAVLILVGALNGFHCFLLASGGTTHTVLGRSSPGSRDTCRAVALFAKLTTPCLRRMFPGTPVSEESVKAAAASVCDNQYYSCF